MQLKDPVGIIYSSVGQDAPYYKLVEEFYSRVEGDPVLRPLYPEDLSQAKEHLALFLIQRTGGAHTYSLTRGEPRMRARHLPFRIGVLERNAWMHHMTNALHVVPEFKSHIPVLLEFFEGFATFMINQPAG